MNRRRMKKLAWALLALVPAICALAGTPTAHEPNDQWQVVEKLPNRQFHRISLDQEPPESLIERRPPVLASIFAIGDTVWTVGEGGTLARTQDGGQTWEVSELRYDPFLRTIWFIDPRLGFAGGTVDNHDMNWHDVIYETDDGGRTWAPIKHLPRFHLGSTNGLTFLDRQNGWAVVQAEDDAEELGFVLHTQNGGKAWRLNFQAPSDRFSAIRFVDKRNGWVLGAKEVFHASDAGTTWTKQYSSSRIKEYLFGIDLVSAAEGWIVGGAENGVILHTTDGGATWVNVPLNLAGQIAFGAVKFANPMRGWIGGNDGAILETIDGGQHWTVQQTGASQTIGGIALSPHAVFAVGTDGIVLKKAY
jgi:photosystem II stability/assembly factor-like uncharacterized protein